MKLTQCSINSDASKKSQLLQPPLLQQPPFNQQHLMHQHQQTLIHQHHQQDLLTKNGAEVSNGEISVDAANAGQPGLLERPDKKEAPKDKTKPISSTPVSGTPW